MIIYSVRLAVNADILDSWTKWMQDEHIPEMLETKLFSSCQLSRVMEDDAAKQVFVVNYICESIKDYETYITDYSKAMRQKGIKRFGDEISSSRELQEIIE